jgi:hypothetical protein
VIRRIAVLAVLLLLAACQGDGAQQAAPTTTATTVAPTTTTQPDPAKFACKEFGDKPFDALEGLLISRDERIVNAAKAYEDATRGGPTGEFAQAVEEIVRACAAAGYL